MKNVAFIGVGVMGKSMVRNLMKNGYPVSIYIGKSCRRQLIGKVVICPKG